MILLDGRALSKKLLAQIKNQISTFSQKPGLAVILVGDDPASAVYVRNKHKACEDVGIQSTVIKLPSTISKAELIAQIENLNSNPSIHGILVQLPLPKHLPTEEIIGAVSEKKDVDGFHCQNAGKLFRGVEGLVPCTPKGVIKLLEEHQVPLEGAHAVILGRSNVVGKPMAMLLLEKNATVTICHAHTRDTIEHCRRADVIVSAVGRVNLVTKDWVKPGACVVDVGINRKPDGKLTGDVDFEEVSKVAGYLTPVPGGVGPMTIAMLIDNTFQAFRITLPHP